MGRIAENAVIQDGIMYKPGQEIPDLGNWTSEVYTFHGKLKKWFKL